jgi:hypothetical protein
MKNAEENFAIFFTKSLMACPCLSECDLFNCRVRLSLEFSWESHLENGAESTSIISSASPLQDVFAYHLDSLAAFAGLPISASTSVERMFF